MKDKFKPNDINMESDNKKTKDCSLCMKQRCRKSSNCYPEYNQDILGHYHEPENLKLSRMSAAIEAQYYNQATRLEETAHFALAMGYKKLGIASCVGLVNEAQTIAAFLKKNFAVSMIVCKNGGLNKKELELQQIDPQAEEVMCNPIGQAFYLNQCETDLNLICGLCVGHDLLFTKYSEAPVSTIIVKDRLLAHNPAAALYSSYHRKRIL